MIEKQAIYDVLVIGGGNVALCAAISAHGKGASNADPRLALTAGEIAVLDRLRA